MKDILERLKNEPALVLGFVGAVIALALAFGLELTDEQEGAIMAVTVAVLAIITRTQVTPTRKVAAKATDAGHLVTGPAAPPAGESAAVVVSDDGTGLNPDEHGAVDTGWLIAAACVVVIVVGLVWLFQAL